MIVHKIPVDHKIEDFMAYYDICSKYSAKSDKYSVGEHERTRIKHDTYPAYINFPTLFYYLKIHTTT